MKNVDTQTATVETAAVAPAAPIAAPVLKSGSPTRAAVIGGLTGVVLHAVGNASINNFTKNAVVQIATGGVGGALAGYFGDKALTALAGEQVTGAFHTLNAINLGMAGSSIAVLTVQAGINTVNKLIETDEAAGEDSLSARIAGYFSKEEPVVYEAEAEVVAA